MTRPRACPECLRRAQLLSHLAPYIEKAETHAAELLGLTSPDLTAAVAPRAAEQILAQVEATPERQLRTQLEQSGCWATCKHDPEFPVGLRDAPGAPWALFGRGDPVLLARLRPEGAVTVVGARRASAYGREVARELGRDLAGSGFLVISGMSFGVGACAHRGALEAGPTVAVLGCGPDIAYPASNRSLWRRICEDGLVLSELPPGSAPGAGPSRRAAGSWPRWRA
jgi:DNA processing protein